MRVAGTHKGKRGQVRTEEAELAITISFLRRTLSEAGVRRVLSRLEVIGPMSRANAAAGRRSFTLKRRKKNGRSRLTDLLNL